MLLYYLFWMLMWLFIHFYIIFGTNLLTQGPVQIAFLPISVFRRKRISNGIKPSGAWFLEQTWSRGLRVDVKQPTRKARGRGGTPTPLGAPSTLVGPSWLHRPPSSSYIYLRTPKPSRSTTNTWFHRRNLLYPRDPILGPFPELQWRGHWSRRASTSTPWPLRWCVSSLLQTFGSKIFS